jgi:hypothetical protein
MYRVIVKRFGEIENGDCFVWAAIDAYTAAGAELFINVDLPIRTLRDALLFHAVDRAEADAKIVPAGDGITLILLDNSNARHFLRWAHAIYKCFICRLVCKLNPTLPLVDTK